MSCQKSWPRHRVHAGGGFIQQQQARAMDQRTGQPQFLFHPARKLARQPALKAGQPHELEQLRRAGGHLCAAHRAYVAEEAQVLLNG